jgi:pimeloyl-ACP methyl ester carboxylesterase
MIGRTTVLGQGATTGARRGMPQLTLVHGSAATPAQWDGLVEHLPIEWCVERVRLAGCDGDHLDPGLPYGLQVELQRIAAPPIEAAPRLLVGHSMGGLLAAAACLARPGCCDALVLFEPVLFGLLARPGFAAARRDVQAFLHYFASLRDPARQLDAARAMFHFWRLFGAWEALSPARRERLAACMPKVRLECSLFDDPAVQADRLVALARLPIVWVSGSESPAHIDAVRRSFCELLPDTEVVEIPGAGHLGHVTHPRELAAVLARLVRRVEGRQALRA